MAGTEVERTDGLVNGVYTADVPSAAWGWSKINHRSWHLVGGFIVFFLLMMLRGNHTGKVEDIFLVVFALGTLFFLVRDLWGRHRGWLR